MQNYRKFFIVRIIFFKRKETEIYHWMERQGETKI